MLLLFDVDKPDYRVVYL